MLEPGTMGDMTRAEEGEHLRDRMMLELRRRWQNHEPPPTYREMADLMGRSLPTIRHHAHMLQDQGLCHTGVLWLTKKGYRRTEPGAIS